MPVVSPGEVLPGHQTEESKAMNYRFGTCTLDTQRHELHRDGARVPLRPKAFQLLTYLLDHRERVVSKDELIEQLWPQQFIGDTALNSCLKEVRQAVGDSGRDQRIIHTLRGRGYRFVAAVDVSQDMSSVDTGPPQSHGDLAEHCPTCRTLQDTSFLFCVTCGTQLAHRCTYCTHIVRLPAAFCPTCGHRLHDASHSPSPASSTPEQEYKHVTILCCAFPDTRQYVQPYSAEAMHTFMQALFATIQAIVQRYAGTITQWSGTACTVLFGAPVAHEDHARHAVRAAYELRKTLPAQLFSAASAQEHSVGFKMGLHTGPVVVGKWGDNTQQLYTAVGTTTQLAALLLQRAAPGSLSISATTYQLVQEDVQVTAEGLLPTSDASAPLAVYTVQEVMRPRAGMSRLGRHPLSRFVGRTRELDMLSAHFAHATEGQGQVVSIVGEPGIGKSRLLDEFCRRLDGNQVTYHSVQCLSYSRATPYQPLINLVRDMCDIRDADAPEAMVTKIHHCLQRLGLAPDEWTPYLHQLLGLPEGNEAVAFLSPEAIQRRTFTTLRRLCLPPNQSTPSILVVEDLQWIDRTSEDFFTSLVASLPGAPMMLVTTHRPGYRPPWLEKSFATQMALSPLSAAESQSLAQSLFAQRQLSEAQVATLLAKAEGNPFFLEELAQSLLGHAEDTVDTTVPNTIQDLIRARIDQLPDVPKQMLHVASVLGREVPLQLLHRLWEGPGDVETHLAMLQQREFLYEDLGAEAPTYLFKHALTQEVAYSSMLHAKRQALHGTIGQALESLHAEHLDDVLERVAHHYGRSTEAAKAVYYLTQLGAKAAQSYAHTEAVTLYQYALDHMAHLPDTERDRPQLDVLLRQALSLSILGRFQDIHNLLLPEQHRVERLQEPILMGQYYFRLGLTAIYLGMFERSVDYTHRARDAACQCHDTATMGMAYHLLAWAKIMSGSFREGMSYGQQAVHLLEQTGERHWLGLAHWDIGLGAGFLGEFPTALTAFAHMHAIGDASDDPRLLCMSESYMAWIYIMQGAYDEAIATCQSSLARSPDPVAHAITIQHLALVYVERGEPAAAIPLLEEVIERFRHFQLVSSQGRFTTVLAEALLAEQRPEEAQHMAQQGLALSRRATSAYGVGLAQRALGRIAHARGDTTAALQYCIAALDTFTTLQAPYEVGRTHLVLAQLATMQQQADAATNLQAARRLFMTLDIPTYVTYTERLADERGITLPAETSC